MFRFETRELIAAAAAATLDALARFAAKQNVSPVFTPLQN